MTVIWFTYEGNPIIDEVQQSGHTCMIATSEIVIRQLVAQYPDSMIVVGHDIAPRRALNIQQSFPTLTINEATTAKHVLIELGMIMGRQKPTQ
jgi:hypothetical protein